jgi:hypothetical protein
MFQESNFDCLSHQTMNHLSNNSVDTIGNKKTFKSLQFDQIINRRRVILLFELYLKTYKKTKT